MQQTFLRPQLLLGENNVIITISGRRVKRPLKNFVAARGRRTLCGGSPVCTRQAKSLAPWAGSQWALTESGEAAMAEQEAFQARQEALERRRSFERHQAAYRALGMHTLADVREIQRRYIISRREDVLGFGDCLGYVDFDGTVNGDFASVIVTGNPDNPFQGVMRGTQVHLPAEAFELAAQLWLAIQSPAGKEAAYVD